MNFYDTTNQNVPRRLRTGSALLVKLAVGTVVILAIGWTAVAVNGELFHRERRSGMTHCVSRGNLVVTVNEQGILESAENIEIKSKVRGYNAVLWIIDSGTFVQKGDELVRLDALFIQEQVDERTKYSNWSQSAADHTAAAVARSKIAVTEYEQGRYPAELMSLKKDIAIAEAAVQNAKDRVRHTTTMANSGYLSELEVEEKQFAVEQAKLNLQLKQTQLEVLKNFTFKEQIQTLQGELTAVKANHKANVERAMADASRRDRAVEELQYCTINAERSGLVIHPNAAKWESAPIAEGTNVHKDQVLLLMPDLTKMQVKIGVHESSVKRVTPGQQATVTMAEGTLDGVVSEVASITKPAGWWTGNQVRYDTLVSLPPVDGLRPGMSAEVEIMVAKYEDVLLIPVAAIVSRDKDSFCWVQTANGPRRKRIELGDSNDVYTIVADGLAEGEHVLLNPAAFEQIGSKTAETHAQKEKAKSVDQTSTGNTQNTEADSSVR